MHSEKCRDPKTRWDKRARKCVSCPLKPGYEITPNCGYDDNGGRHEIPHRICPSNTFNNGSWASCKPCTPCLLGHFAVRPCSSTSDTQCDAPSKLTTKVPANVPTTSLAILTSMPTPALKLHIQPQSRHLILTERVNQGSNITTDAMTTTTTPTNQASSAVLWSVPLAILIFIMLAVLYCCVIYLKRKRGQHTILDYSKRSSLKSQGFSPLFAPACNDDLKDILGSEILSAPLQTVLDNLDVLEQLIILLDPDSPPVKNTRHLASHCSFSSTWITYTYSMKESKSPLKAVLEGVTSRYPDWTVGHLAMMLKQMKRNDAMAVLTQLRLNEMAV